MKDFKLYNADCLKILKKLPDNSVDICLTDPPYGTTACKWDNIIDFKLMWEQLHRVVKDNGAIVLFGSEPFSSALRMSNINNFRYDWIWQKTKATGFMNAKKMPLKSFENISVFYQKLPTYNPQGLIKGVFNNSRPAKKQTKSIYYKNVKDKTHKESNYTNYPKDILTYKKPNKPLHPTQKPVELLEYLIKTYTNKEEIVLDFTMGSGSTGVACKNTNRKFIGIELDKEYFKIAKERIK